MVPHWLYRNEPRFLELEKMFEELEKTCKDNGYDSDGETGPFRCEDEDSLFDEDEGSLLVSELPIACAAATASAVVSLEVNNHRHVHPGGKKCVREE
jgi:hypothetical protein